MNNPNRHLAQMLKYFRHQKGWSLDKTAKETTVSKAMLGQIERGESSPTVAVLWKIATGMQLSLSKLLEPHNLTIPQSNEQQQPTLFRQASTLRYQPTTDDMLIAPLFPFDPMLQFEVFEFTLLPNFERLSLPHAKGVTEHIIVIKGEMALFVDAEWQPLSLGSSVRFAADRPHGYRNLSSSPAVFHNIIYYP